MSLRAIKRNILKKEMGTNKINFVWRNRQIEKYGYEEWLKMAKACNGKKAK